MSIIINSIRTFSHKRISPQKRSVQREVSNLLNQNIRDIVELTQNSSKKQLSLLRTLANNFNKFNYYRKPEKRDNSKLVNEIFEKIKKPNKMSEYIVNNFSDSMDGLNNILNWTGNNKKRLKFVIQLNEDIFKHERPEGNTLISDLLSSPFANKYMEKYSEIQSYLKFNKDKPDAIANLDKKFAQDNFNLEQLGKAIDKDRIKLEYPLLEKASISGEDCLKLLTSENEYLAKTMSNIFHPTNEMLKNGNAKDIANILNSTNKKNYWMREEILQIFIPSVRTSRIQNTRNAKDENLTYLAKLYDILDKDKNANKFVKKSLPQLNDSISIKELVTILDKVSTKKLNIFKDNAWNIILKTENQARIDALNSEITNAFFETRSSRVRNRLQIEYGYKKKPSVFKTLFVKVKNEINILRDAVTSEPRNTTVAVKAETSKEILKPETLIQSQPIRTQNKKEYIKPEFLKVSKGAKREILREKVVSFVKTKLGEKTFNSQREGFSKNATQIRMSMLPEIFASISDTRKVDRLVGKLKSNSSNKDALTLYSKINGQNKKFVNYMLKKRNVDNSRMFEVHDIIAILDKAETKIIKNKKLNSNYRAKDIKAYYNHLFDSKVEQYGKVKKLKTN